MLAGVQEKLAGVITVCLDHQGKHWSHVVYEYYIQHRRNGVLLGPHNREYVYWLLV